MHPDEIARLLPAVFQRTLPARGPSLLGAFLGAMDELQAPAEQILARLDTYFLPDQTPESFLPFLAHWLGLGWLLDEDWLASGKLSPGARVTGRIESRRLRRLLMCAVDLYRQRGTRAALTRFLETATGETNFEIREDPRRPFHMVVVYPRTADRRLVKRIVEWEKPAYVTFDLVHLQEEEDDAGGGSK